MRIFDDKCARMANCLYAQLKARPNPWGIGLWRDDASEKVAKRCAEIFVENFMRCPNDHLIPQDRMCMVEALDDLGDLDGPEAFRQIEEEFCCQLPDELFNDKITFSDFVECVMNGRGKVPPKETTAKDWFSFSWGIAVLLFFLVGLPSYAIYRLYVDIRTIVFEGWTDISIGSLIAESIGAAFGLFIVVGTVWVFLKKDGDPDSRITKM